MGRPAKLNPEKALSDSLAEVVRLFPAEEIRQAAEETGFVKRLRKIDPAIFFWNLILGFSCSVQRTLAGLKRQYQLIADTDLAPSSFFDKFSPNLVRFLRRLLQDSLARFAAPSLPGTLGTMFKDVSIFDNTIVSLGKSLLGIFPRTKTEAAAKITVVLSVACQSARSVAIHAGNVAEIHTVKIGDWVKEHLLLFDLGFFKYGFFAKIIEHGGHFISRLRDDANPLIVAVNRLHRGRSIDLVGKTLKEIRDSLKREEVDAVVEIEFRRRGYAGEKGRLERMTLRLVGVKDDLADDYHFYLTDLSPEALTPEQVANLYRGRWFIEMLFKELKSRYALDVINTSNREVVEAMIYAALLTLTVSRAMFLSYQAHYHRAHQRLTTARWSIIFYENVSRLMVRILRASGIEPDLDDLLAQSLMEAQDPAPHRKRLESVFDL
jgi:IS4 transposase